MSVHTSGEGNRAAGQDFHERNIHIGRYDGRNTINIAIPNEKEDLRPLVKAQRKELNSLVSDISRAGNIEAFTVWQKVHAEIGVSSIEEMTISQYHSAVSFLQAMLDRYKERDASKALVGLLLRNTETTADRQKLIRYCHIHFGTGRLNDLTRSQLQLALTWWDQQIQVETSTVHIKNQDKLKPIEFFKFNQKEVIFIFLVGLLLGKFLF